LPFFSINLRPHMSILLHQFLLFFKFNSICTQILPLFMSHLIKQKTYQFNRYYNFILHFHEFTGESGECKYFLRKSFRKYIVWKTFSDESKLWKKQFRIPDWSNWNLNETIISCINFRWKIMGNSKSIFLYKFTSFIFFLFENDWDLNFKSVKVYNTNWVIYLRFIQWKSAKLLLIFTQ
jgi:hypothetical protein